MIENENIYIFINILINKFYVYRNSYYYDMNNKYSINIHHYIYFILNIIFSKFLFIYLNID
jgi:hypothetical protein